MNHGNSGLAHGTSGSPQLTLENGEMALQAIENEMSLAAEDFFERIMPNGDRNIDFTKLPGSKGIEMPKRLTDKQMMFLTNEYGVEFAQVYVLGSGKTAVVASIMSIQELSIQ